MACILIIGYGNPLRGDDGFGWHLARRLEEQAGECDVQVMSAHQLTPEMAEPVSRARYVIFADANADPNAEELTLKKLWADPAGAATFSHNLSPETLLQMASTLYGSAPHAAFLLTARAHEMGYSGELSPQMAVELDRAVKRVLELCEFLDPQGAEHVFVPEKMGRVPL